MREKLYNQRFDDIYFSPEDGLAETRHVFLSGNGLPRRWDGQKRFTIVETGFGTGLNFLAAWNLFEQTAQSGQVLDFISFELYPLSREEIAGALETWREELGGKLDDYLAEYPIRTKGFHRIILAGGRVRLTIVFDEVNEALPELAVSGGVDAWFLDGFAPAKNPQMWTQTVYREMARLSKAGATVSTFTAAGHVRRGLEDAGFAVEKKPGYGRKREMSTGVFQGERADAKERTETKRIAVIGGGLAGTACAYVLNGQGIKTTIFECSDELAAGASGNKTGLYNPRFSAQRTPEADFYIAAYAMAVRTMKALSEKHDIDFHQCGTLHLINSPEKEKRFNSLLQSWGWHADHVRRLPIEQASEVAGIAIDKEALFLPDSGFVSPKKLCDAYASQLSMGEVRLGTPVNELEQSGKDWLVNGDVFDAVILACGAGARNFAGLEWLPLHTVRGQVSYVSANRTSERIKCNICYGGYIVPSAGGEHIIGATFQKWLDDTELRNEDHRANLDYLYEALPALEEMGVIKGGRAALRAACRDRFPVIGTAPDADGGDIEGLYLSAGHGSHGILSSLMGAYLIADLISGAPLCLPQKTVDLLSGRRFAERALHLAATSQ